MTGMNGTAMLTAMMSASTAMMQAQTQNNARVNLNGKAGVLESEIQLDGSRGDEESVNRKEKELSRVRQAAQDGEANQMGTLSKANEAMKEAAEKDSEEAEKEPAVKSHTDQVELSRTSKDEAGEKAVAELLDAVTYAGDGSLIPQAELPSFQATA